MSSLQDQYRALRRESSASMIYQQPQAPAARPNIYEGSQAYAGLSGYQGGAADKLDQRPGESYEAYARRLGALARALPEGEVERRLEAATKRASEQSWSWEAHRADVDGQVGSGTGIMGNLSPQDRAAVVGGRWGGREIAGMGHLTAEPISDGRPLSNVEVGQIVRQREAERRGHLPQRTDATSLRSTGTGFMGTDRG